MTLTSTNSQLKHVCIKKLGAKNVLAFRARGGFIQGDAPYSQLFTLGGADSLRGYEDDQFRGKYMYNATLEFRFPIVKKVSGVLFTDIGDAWDAPKCYMVQQQEKPLTMALVLVFVLQHLSVLLNLTMAWVNTKINSTSASVHNSNIVKVYGGGLFSKRLSPISLYGIL